MLMIKCIVICHGVSWLDYMTTFNSHPFWFCNHSLPCCYIYSTVCPTVFIFSYVISWVNYTGFIRNTWPRWIVLQSLSLLHTLLHKQANLAQLPCTACHIDKKSHAGSRDEYSCERANRALHAELLRQLHANSWSDCVLAPSDPDNSNKWPLKFSHLSRQKCSRGFHHQSPHWSLCIHAKPTEKKNMTVGSELSTNDASRLEVWVRPSVKCQTGSFQGTLVGRTKWKPSFMWGKRERTFGLYFAVCGWLCVPLKCHPRQSCNRNRSCSLYFSRVIIYVPAMNFHSSSPCTKTSHISPKTRWNKAE